MRRLMAIIRAIVQSLSQAFRWCRKAGAYVVDRSVKASAATVEATSEVLEATAELGAQAASIPGRLIGGLLGGGGGVPVPPPGDDDAAHERRMLDVKKATQALEAGRQPQPKPALMRPRDMFGEIVHAYAAADPVARLALDLDMLPPHLRTWLVSLGDKELRKLAAAGPEACGEVASGRRRIVGIAVPEAAVDGDDAVRRHVKERLQVLKEHLASEDAYATAPRH